MRLVTPRATVPSRYWYAYGTYLDQTGDTCVANAWTHFLADSPTTHRLAVMDAVDAGYRSAQSGETGFRGRLYDEAQQADEFSDTPPAGGTSVRAAAKVLQAEGRIASYHWAQTISDVVRAVLTVGPVVVGTNWYESMFDPVDGVLRVDPASGVAGGHAYVLNGCSTTKRTLRLKNSWSKAWGRAGHATIGWDDFAGLLVDGEACIGLEA